MSGCCDPSGYDELFDPKEAGRNLKVYDKKGLNRMAARTVDYLKSRGVEGHRILEVGGGIGAVQVELLKAGAASAVNVELSDGYREAAAELLRRHGLEGRVEERIGDFTEVAAELEADDVIMNRVICCYPDMDRLLTAGLSASRRFLVAVFPRDRWMARIFVAVGNAYQRVKGVDFRAYIHSPEAIRDTAQRAGFRVAFADRDLVWHGVVFERTG